MTTRRAFLRTLTVLGTAAVAACGKKKDRAGPVGKSGRRLATVYRAVNRIFPGRRSVQFGFPYVDTLRIQQEFGHGVHFFPRGDQRELRELAGLLGSEPVSAVFCEFPSNPLLNSANLTALSELGRRHGFPLIVDETLGTYVNVDLRPLELAAEVDVARLPLGEDLQRSGYSVQYDTSTARALGQKATPVSESDAGLAIVIGGDGSILLAVQRMRRQIPVLGINWGEVGFLADLEPAEAVEFLLAGVGGLAFGDGGLGLADAGLGGEQRGAAAFHAVFEVTTPIP